MCAFSDSGNSGSMDSDQLSNLMGHNYASAVHNLYLPRSYDSLTAEDVMFNPWSPTTRQQIREEAQVFSSGGCACEDAGPADMLDDVSSVHTDTSFHAIEGTKSLNQGVLLLKNYEHGESSKIANKAVAWSSVVSKNVPKQNAHEFCNANIEFNQDGTANINPPKNFLMEARKQWDSSLIGHFIGGEFSFKYVKEHALRLWKNCGLSNVYYSSKGYFTFRFDKVENKNFVLNQNSVQMGGRTMYRVPWMEGSRFKRNVVNKIPCWIKLVDVPQSYWSKEGLCLIAQAVERPMKFDAVTAHFKPLKYAGIQVELVYDSPRPAFVWVPIIDVDGREEMVKVEVQYPQFPYSCSICRDFGHSMARCSANPEANRPKPKQQQPKPAQKRSAPNSDISQAKQSTNVTEQQPQGPKEQENFVDNFHSMAMVPYVVGQFCGCDLVLDEDEILRQGTDPHLEVGADDLAILDIREAFNHTDLSTSNPFEVLQTQEGIEEGEILQAGSCPSAKAKKKQRLDEVIEVNKGKGASLEIVLNIPPGNIRDTPVSRQSKQAASTSINKKDPRKAGKAAKPRNL